MYVVLRKVQRENRSFALELERDGVDDEARLFYLSGHKVHFVDMDLSTLGRELRARIRHAPPAGDGAQNGDAPPHDAPTVFVCHAHEDAAFADRVAIGLRQNGINVWLDKESLRGGDEWDAMIERVIEEEVQYVVVLQSASLKAKDVGYVNKEINLALSRRQYYRPPRVFLIPAIIDSPASMLAELAGIEAVDLSTGAGIDELVRAIRRDLDAAGRMA
jgi:hypothetical protein